MTGTRRTRLFTALTASLAILWAGAACSKLSGPPKPDVNAELQKLKIPTIPKKLNAAQIAMVEKAWDGPAKFFVQRGCIACHNISIHDIKGLTTIGPDLSIAVEDVKTRFGRTVEDFLDRDGPLNLRGTRVSINLIPHTVTHTALSELRVGVAVNLEIDTVARYVERMLSAGLNLKAPL